MSYYLHITSTHMTKIITWIAFILSLLAAIGVAILFIFTWPDKKEAVVENVPVANETPLNVPTNVVEEPEEDDELTEETYENKAGYTLTLPAGWTATDTEVLDNPNCDEPFNIVTFVDPDFEYNLVLGLREKGDDVTISCRTGVGAGEFESGDNVTVAGKKIETTHLVFEDRVTEIFLGDEKINIPVPLDGFEISASFSFVGEQNEGDLPDLTKVPEYDDLIAILESLELPQ
jgi:hypothetical protein